MNNTTRVKLPISIPVYNQNNEIVANALIDAKSAKSVNKYNWYLQPNGHVANDKQGLLYKFVSRLRKDGPHELRSLNKLDCTRPNILASKVWIIRTKSGVHWVVLYRLKGSVVKAGSFRCEEDADKKYAEIELMLSSRSL